MNPRADRPTPLGVADVAKRLNVTEDTVTTWRRRSKREWVNVPKFPDPDGTLSGRDWWWPETIDVWALAAGRLPQERP